MAITPLPPSTVHLLGSAQTLTNPLSLVKELLDNALDAKATSIDVLISKDTLEKIEVRDNGQGIPQDDLDALGRRGHTSKLRSFDELRSIGGTSLGFRGEALASAVQLGEVSITTKTEGEAVATCVTLKSLGGLLKQSRTSHPVGTTVCVKHFMYKLPVRKQTALKAAAKTLVHIKELLQSFALARLTVKFNLRIAKESKGSWSFIPRPTEGIGGAAKQIIGRDATTECVEKILYFSECRPGDGSPAEDFTPDYPAVLSSSPSSSQFIVEMFLLNPAPNPAKLGHGQYLSVDSRTVASDKGTMKKIVSLYKLYLKGSCGEMADAIKNPFIRMNIACPISSYDPNVEPAKDDIIFSNEDWILESMEGFLREFYGEPKTTSRNTTRQKLVHKLHGFELLLSRRLSKSPMEEASSASPGYNALSKPSTVVGSNFQDMMSCVPENMTVEDEESVSMDEVEMIASGSHQSKWGINMSSDLSEEVEGANSRNKNSFHDAGNFIAASSHVERSSSNGLNPWVIAKLTAPVRPRLDFSPSLAQLQGSSLQASLNFPPTPNPSSGPSIEDIYQQKPVAHSQRHRRLSDPAYQMATEISQDHDHFQFETPNRHYSRIHTRRRSLGHARYDNMVQASNVLPFPCQNGFVSARKVTEEILTRPTVPETVKLPSKGREGLNKPFVSPLLNVENSFPRDNLRQTTTMGAHEQPQDQRTIRNDFKQTEEDPDQNWTMDYENRKEELTRQQRKRMKAARAKAVAEEEAEEDRAVIQSSPHKNRFLAAVSNLDQRLPSPSSFAPTATKSLMPDGDPRAYLIRRQKSIAAQPATSSESGKAVRMKSSRLPLERIPAAEQLHSLALSISSSIAIMEALSGFVGGQDLYVETGELANGLLMNETDMRQVTQKIRDIAMRWTKAQTDGEIEFEYTFDNLPSAES